MAHKIRKLLTPLLTAFLLITGFFGFGCQQAEQKTEPAAPLVYHLKWLENAGTAGELYAVTHGLFEKEAVRVIIKGGGPEHSAINELELGNCQFGVASADQVIRALDKGADLVVLAQIFQRNPLQWIYRRQGSGGLRPEELKGKRLGVTYGGNDEAILNALMAVHKLTGNDLQISGARRDWTPFLQGEVDLWPTYRNVEGVAIARKLASDGEQVDFFDPGAHGINFVANSVITTGAYYNQHREATRKVVKAAMSGWQAALDPGNEAMATAAVQKYDRYTDPAIIAEQLRSTRPLVIPASGFPVGRIDRAAWLQTEAIMLEQGLIREPVHIDQHLQDLTL